MKASKILARIGVLIVLVSLGYTWFLLETRTTRFYGYYGMYSGPCTGRVQPYQPTMILGDSQVLTLTAHYGEPWTNMRDYLTGPCRLQAELAAPEFEVSPQAKQEIELPPGEEASLSWTITPTTVGTHAVEVSNGGNKSILTIIVVERSALYDLTGLTLQQVINGTGYLFGLALMLPWLTTAWRRHENVLSALSPQRDLFNVSILSFAGAVAWVFFGTSALGGELLLFVLALATLFTSWLVGRIVKGH